MFENMINAHFLNDHNREEGAMEASSHTDLKA